MKLFRLIEQIGHQFSQCPVRQFRALEEIGHGGPPEAQFRVSAKGHSGKVTVCSVPDEQAENASIL